MKKIGITYEIYCKRGFNRENCRFIRQNKEAHCSICSFVSFLERNKEDWEQHFDEEDKNGQ